MPDASNYGLSVEQIAEDMGVPVEMLTGSGTYANAEQDYAEQFEYLKGVLERELNKYVHPTPNVGRIEVTAVVPILPDHITVTFVANRLCDHVVPALGEN